VECEESYLNSACNGTRSANPTRIYGAWTLAALVAESTAQAFHRWKSEDYVRHSDTSLLLGCSKCAMAGTRNRGIAKQFFYSGTVQSVSRSALTDVEASRAACTLSCFIAPACSDLVRSSAQTFVTLRTLSGSPSSSE
jgi:hypothetical protein